jgi:hypothetical protein
MTRRTVSKVRKTALISRAEAARLKGVQRSSVSKACRQGGPLEAAARGPEIDPSDPAFIAWITEAPRGPDGGAIGTPEPVPAPSKAEMLELSRRKRAAEAEKLELANAQTRGALISRELVKTHVFGAIEAANKRLLGDAAKTIASKVVNSTRAKGTLEEALRIVREEIGKQLRTSKDRVTRVLRRNETGVPMLAASAKRRARKVAKR